MTTSCPFFAHDAAEGYTELLAIVEVMGKTGNAVPHLYSF